jgi:hypothetical protein
MHGFPFTLFSEFPKAMKDEDIADAEARGFASLKWDAAEKGDIEAALEMQKAETESLCRLAGMIEQPDTEDLTEVADWWKPETEQ